MVAVEVPEHYETCGFGAVSECILCGFLDGRQYGCRQWLVRRVHRYRWDIGGENQGLGICEPDLGRRQTGLICMALADAKMWTVFECAPRRSTGDWYTPRIVVHMGSMRNDGWL